VEHLATNQDDVGEATTDRSPIFSSPTNRRDHADCDHPKDDPMGLDDLPMNSCSQGR
jgi:hypothetical protein